jgi:hypothetical protein
MTWTRVAETCGAVATAFIAWLARTSAAVAASPSPDPIGGDPRSSGQGPGLVGDPLLALLAVVAIGVLSVIATLIYVRLTAQRGR